MVDMNISAKIIACSHIEDNSKTLFNMCEKRFLLLKGEGRNTRMNRTAGASKGFAVISHNSDPCFSFISRKKEIEFA